MPDPVLVARAPATLKRTILQTFDVPAGDAETVIARSELGPNQITARHSHPGPEAGYVIEGSGGILVEGRPPIVLEAGQSYQLGAGVPHALRSDARGINVVVTWAKAKGQPLASPTD